MRTDGDTEARSGPIGGPAAAAGPRRLWTALRARGSSSGIVRRLFVAFALVVFTFALASALMLRNLTAIDDGLVGMQDHEEGVRLALALASAVRDQYAHQAHTIILGNATHVGFYDAASSHVRELVLAVRAHVRSPEEASWVDDIAAKSHELDGIFYDHIVPAVLSGARGEVELQHARAQRLVTLIQERTDQLATRFQESIVALRAQARAARESALRWTVFFLVAAPLFAAAVGLYIGGSIARPLALLHSGARRLAGGDLDTRIPLETRDELGALARQFNVMTASLREHERKLVESEKLAGIGRLAAGVAHEINNPVGVILGYARVLAREARGEALDDLRIIEEEALRCKEIVRGLLDLARPLRLGRDPVDVASLCREVCARLVELGRAGADRLRVRGTARVVGDGEKLRQVIVNLVKNGLEAAGEGGEVRIDIEQGQDGVAIRIADSGPGVNPEVASRLFEPFTTTKPDGTGLGLAVSRAIAKAHGGDIVVASGPLSGACFILRLPNEPPTPAEGEGE